MNPCVDNPNSSLDESCKIDSSDLSAKVKKSLDSIQTGLCNLVKEKVKSFARSGKDGKERFLLYSLLVTNGKEADENMDLQQLKAQFKRDFGEKVGFYFDPQHGYVGYVPLSKAIFPTAFGDAISASSLTELAAGPDVKVYERYENFDQTVKLLRQMSAVFDSESK